MKKMNKSQLRFIIFAYTWSFVFWGISIYLVWTNKLTLMDNPDTLKALLNNNLSGYSLTVTTLSAIAGYGPLLAAIFIYYIDDSTKAYFDGKFKNKVAFKYVIQVLGLFLLITIIPSIIIMFINKTKINFDFYLLGLLLLFFIYQMITTGTEELGWRGYLLPSLLEYKNPWQASVLVGLLWSFWHTPIILYVFYSQGMGTLQIISSFIGFIAGTIAMSTVHTYYYLKTKNVLFSVFIHAVSNTIPMFVGMVFASTYEISVAVQVLLWGYVIIITNRNKEMFDKKPVVD